MRFNAEAITAELEQVAKAYKPRTRPWTEAERVIVRSFYGRVPINALSAKLGRTVAAVSDMGKRLRNEVAK